MYLGIWLIRQSRKILKMPSFFRNIWKGIISMIWLRDVSIKYVNYHWSHLKSNKMTCNHKNKEKYLVKKVKVLWVLLKIQEISDHHLKILVFNFCAYFKVEWSKLIFRKLKFLIANHRWARVLGQGGCVHRGVSKEKFAAAFGGQNFFPPGCENFFSAGGFY